ncbi:MAG: polysaccharide biosynthesis protein [Bacteroidaceae bacterium]
MMKPIKRLLNWFLSRGALPYWFILLIDCFMVFVSGLAVYYLQYGAQMMTDHFAYVSFGLMVSLLVFVLSFFAFHTYRGVLRYSSFVDLNRLAYSTATACAVVCLLHQMQVHDTIVPDIYFPRFKSAVLIFILATSMMWALRVFVKTLHDSLRHSSKAKNVFIYGCQTGGIALAKSVLNSVDETYRLVGFISDDPSLEGSRLLGIPIYFDDERIVDHMREKKASVIFVSPIQSQQFTNHISLIDRLIGAGIRIMMVPAAQEWDGKGELTHQQLRKVEIEDLLPRDRIEIDMEAIGEMLQDRCILITGAAGSIGAEMARQVAQFHPSHLILIDQAESPMHDMRLYMAYHHKNLHVETIVTSICKQDRMERIFSEFRPEYVFHAAAYKHVPMMEDNPAEAVQNNIYGTRVIADLSVKYGTRKFVMISTDKAVNPTNVMGCSKRICEIYCQALNNKLWEETCQTGRRTTQFVTTRFGNVLGSSGSVIPIFKEQIRKGGPVTVTHKDIIRYFMLIPEACRLVLQAGTMGHGGEIYVFDMGKPVRISDLAQRMIDLSGAKNVKIEFTGLREGEKLYEELLSTKENTKPTKHPKIMVAQVREYPYDLALQNEMDLYRISLTFDDMAIVRKMKEIVPEFKSNNSKYESLDER